MTQEQKPDGGINWAGVLAMLAVFGFIVFLFLLPWLGDTLAPYRSIIGLMFVAFLGVILVLASIAAGVSLVRFLYRKPAQQAPERHEPLLLLDDQQQNGMILPYQRGYGEPKDER